ncbi:protein EARLY-RESPONSIVE TO DEHYDRATION 7 [Citrus sinensis]|uniref:protein EARLY-RESPONSIVE TO DEHYDRATION 7, chloroplastic n=1 Tax=Citrus sinensis TaxID=2711 RepID=UPI0003D715C3|nr:protein EARLY-RESPONSIVE TO DEHYDRATION 7, chloroplastic [Citrus sinensis]KAH9662666.1 protein EARLY-RESPONSIVE TO DEHYDRATION 7 [Citrus sinensis]
MSYQQPIPNPNHTSLYPQVIDSNPEAPINYKSQSPPSSSQSPPSNLYPSLDMRDLTENLFPETAATGNTEPSAPPQADEETLIKVPGAILHLIDQSYSVELACSDFKIIRLIQDGNVVAVLASVGDEVQWPLTKDIAAVKLDDSHYFFSLSFPPQPGSNSDSDLLNYGLTIASKGQEKLLQELDGILQQYSCFSVQKVSEKVKEFDGEIAKEVTPLEMTGKKREVMEEKSAAYWTTLAPNVEDYSGTAAKLIAAGSGQLIRGILWCGEVTVDRLKWGNKVLKKRMIPGETSEVSPRTLKRIKRAKRVTKMTEKVATGVLSGVVKVSGFFTSSVANTKAGKKFFNLLPGEIVLASLDGFNKVCDAVEVSGKNVMSTSSTVTTQLVSHKYGEKAAEATSEGLDAAGHAIGTAWAAFKIRKALNPKSVLKPTTLAKSAAKAASEVKGKKSSK